VTGRFTRPEEVADLIVLLAGERAGNVTGSDFVIDGGLLTTLRVQGSDGRHTYLTGPSTGSWSKP